MKVGVEEGAALFNAQVWEDTEARAGSKTWKWRMGNAGAGPADGRERGE